MSAGWKGVTRDVTGIEIPGGGPVTLKAGSQVVLRQALGGTFTVLTDRGTMVRIEGRDAEAIGEAAPGPATAEVGPLTTGRVEERVWAELKNVYDPEIPINIVELGLVYLCRVEPRPDARFDVRVDFTLTAPGCGMGDILRNDIEARLAVLQGVGGTRVNVVFDPVWTPDRMSEEAKLALHLV